MGLTPDTRMYGTDKKKTVKEYFEELFEEHNIPKDEGIMEEACEVVDEYREVDVWKWRMSELLRGALYLVLKRRDIPIDAIKLSKENENREIIYSRWKDIARTLGEPIKPFSSDAWFDRISEVLQEEYDEVTPDLIEEAKEIANELEDSGQLGVSCGYSPKAFVSSVFYYMLRREGLDVTRNEFSHVVNISKSTLKDNREEMKEILGG